MAKNRKIWNPPIEDIKWIRDRYATYNSKETSTKTRILKKYGISSPVFDRFCVRNGITPKQEPKGYTRDFTGYKRVSVPDPRFNCNTVILVHPDRCPEEAKKKYIERLENLPKKPWQV